MTQKQLALAMFSGGLDSTTLVYDLLAQGYNVELISFNYGQRHKKELIFASATAKTLGLKHDIIDLSGLQHLISNSALTAPRQELVNTGKPTTSEIEVPEGHYAQDNMALTVVPNRNMIMLAIAAGVAVNRKANMVATAVHAGDHFVYPDCRPRFIAAANAAVVIGNEGFGPIGAQTEGFPLQYYIEAPFLNTSKADIALKALELDVPLHMTWSCYKGGANHCGRCGTCVERLEAIDEAVRRFTWEHNLASIKDGKALIDMTTYDDKEFWKVQIAKAKQEAKSNG